MCLFVHTQRILPLYLLSVFVENIELKTRAMDEYPAIKELYKSPDNPIFKIFYIDIDEIKTFDFAEGEKIFKMK